MNILLKFNKKIRKINILPNVFFFKRDLVRVDEKISELRRMFNGNPI